MEQQKQPWSVLSFSRMNEMLVTIDNETVRAAEEMARERIAELLCYGGIVSSNGKGFTTVEQLREMGLSIPEDLQQPLLYMTYKSLKKYFPELREILGEQTGPTGIGSKIYYVVMPGLLELYDVVNCSHEGVTPWTLAHFLSESINNLYQRTVCESLGLSEMTRSELNKLLENAGIRLGIETGRSAFDSIARAYRRRL